MQASNTKARNGQTKQARKRVTILQEYVPRYREAMFLSLIDECAKRGIDLTIAAGMPRGSQLKRNDASLSVPIRRVQQRELAIFGQRISFRNVTHLYTESDLTIVEQARRNLDVYLALLRPHPTVALWGHGSDMVEQKGAISRRLLRWITRRAVWFFAYTENGKQSVLDYGFPAERITVVKNSTDTAGLARGKSKVTPSESALVKKRNGLTDFTALFVGALDESKRLDFLISAATLARSLNPEFRLLLVGDGPLRAYVEREIAGNDTVVLMPPAAGEELARLASTCRVIAMPGRVGLVAVDSLVLGLPVVTTDWPWHAPEREYLDDSTSVTSPDNPEAFAASMTSLMADEARLSRMRDACLVQSLDYSAEAMARRFASGIERALSVGSGDSRTRE